MKLGDILKLQAALKPEKDKVVESLRSVALDLKEAASQVRILRPESIYADAMNGIAAAMFEIACDIEEDE